MLAFSQVRSDRRFPFRSSEGRHAWEQKVVAAAHFHEQRNIAADEGRVSTLRIDRNDEFSRRPARLPTSGQVSFPESASQPVIDPLLLNEFVIPVDPESGNAPFIGSDIPLFVEMRGGDYFLLPSMTAPSDDRNGKRRSDLT